MATKQYPEAKALLQELLAERPQASQRQYQLGKVCFALNEMESAIRHFEQAIALNPNDADSRYWIGGIKQTMGDIDAAEAAYAAATQIRPLVRRKAIKRPPDFRLLALYAPFNGNTPINTSSRMRPTTSIRSRFLVLASQITPRSGTSMSSST
jgi:tetratricopeptide (TPR) repeat protein